ncbi:MAG: O-methyltransferase, partial [Candidatus Sericytochromatia bacterium]
RSYLSKKSMLTIFKYLLYRYSGSHTLNSSINFSALNQALESRRNKMPLVANDIDIYCERHSHSPSPVLDELFKATHERTEWAIMLVGPLEASVLRMLIQTSGARRVLELGTFTGYSALAMAEALPPDGQLITLDTDAETTAIGKEFWALSPHGDKIESRIGAALDLLPQLEGKFDLIFIDADKQNYPHYWEACVPMLNPGGLIVVDNVFLGGRALNPDSAVSAAVDGMNKRAHQDPRVECTMLSVRDGMLVGRRHHAS